MTDDLIIIEQQTDDDLRVVTTQSRFGRRLPHAGETGHILRRNNKTSEHATETYLLLFENGDTIEYTADEIL